MEMERQVEGASLSVRFQPNLKISTFQESSSEMEGPAPEGIKPLVTGAVSLWQGSDTHRKKYGLSGGRDD